MNVVWEHGPIRAKSIHRILAEEGHPHDLDSVKTYLARMLKKGAVASTREGKAYLYSSIVSREAMVEAELERCWRKLPVPVRGKAVKHICSMVREELQTEDVQDILTLFKAQV